MDVTSIHFLSTIAVGGLVVHSALVVSYAITITCSSLTESYAMNGIILVTSVILEIISIEAARLYTGNVRRIRNVSVTFGQHKSLIELGNDLPGVPIVLNMVVNLVYTIAY